MKSFLITCLLIIAFSLSSSYAESNKNLYEKLDSFGDVFDLIQKNYVEEVEDEKVIEFAINGMLQALDPHSGYMNTEQYIEMQEETEGEFGGLGIEVTMENGLVKVVSPIDETPAAKAGILSGDFISHIDDEAVMGLSLSEAVDKMRGAINTPIIITIIREGKEPFNIKIIRDIIKITSVKTKIYDDIGYLRITSFTQKTHKNLVKEFSVLEKEMNSNIKGLVLDLRNNPGGLLDQAVSVSDAFLNRGEIVSTRGRESNAEQRFNASKGDITKGIPIVVLINGGSASASEIVAGALQDQKRAILLGETTYGKGSVQSIIPLKNRGAVRLTISKYYLPSGKSISEIGVTPDIKIEEQDEDFLINTKTDNQLNYALKLLNG